MEHLPTSTRGQPAAGYYCPPHSYDPLAWNARRAHNESLPMTARLAHNCTVRMLHLSQRVITKGDKPPELGLYIEWHRRMATDRGHNKRTRNMHAQTWRELLRIEAAIAAALAIQYL